MSKGKRGKERGRRAKSGWVLRKCGLEPLLKDLDREDSRLEGFAIGVRWGLAWGGHFLAQVLRRQLDPNEFDRVATALRGAAASLTALGVGALPEEPGGKTARAILQLARGQPGKVEGASLSAAATVLAGVLMALEAEGQDEKAEAPES